MSAPRAVTRGEIPPGPFSVSIDWLAFTYCPRSEHWRSELRAFLFEGFGIEDEWQEGAGGWQGYERSARVGSVLIAWGGAGQRGTVHCELPGRETGACDRWAFVADWLSMQEAKLTRVDIAGDDYFGQEVTVEKAVEWFRAGAFRVEGTAGRPTAGRLVDDLGAGTGKTLYVGSRENGKLARIYEKGRQLGDSRSRWCRFEVEWRARSRVLSVEMLLHPSRFLAGSYACARWWGSVSATIRTVRERAKLNYAAAIHHARMQCGKVVSMILQVSGGDVWQVVAALRRSGLPSRIDERELIALTSG